MFFSVLRIYISVFRQYSQHFTFFYKLTTMLAYLPVISLASSSHLSQTSSA